jgi:hypothetical protein
MSDRRAAFFAFAAVVCFLLIPLAEDKYKEVAGGVGLVYILLAVASALDHWSRRRSG